MGHEIDKCIMESYLTGKKYQLVCLKDLFYVGPLLFALYINDLPTVIKDSLLDL